MEIRKLCDEIFEDVVDIRRRIHRHPEVGMECGKTIDLICAELDKYGITYKRLDNSGVIAEIAGTKENSDKTIILRADMDALDIKEETGLPFSSEIEGKMHACGHDMHTAMLLGTSRILSENKDKFKGKVRLLFQAGEEVSDGALYLIKHGALDGASMGFAMHMDPLSKTHTISARKGPVWAAVDRFKVTVTGKGGHGAMPHKNIDATICTSSLALNLQTLVSRECDPLKSLVVTIGQFHSGTAYNIISEKAILEGTCRCFDDDVYNSLPESFERVCRGIAEAYRCEVDIEFERLCKPLINDDKAFDLMQESAKKILLNEDDFFISEKAMIGEDFSEYASRIPCVFVHLGADGGYPLHNSHINFNEDSMKTGMALAVQFALDALDN